MNKLIVSFAVMFFICALLSGIMEGGGGVNATKLNGDHTAVVTILTVDSTEGFLNADYVVIGDERIQYTWTDDTHFGRLPGDPCVRAYDGTDAEAHSDDVMVYSGEANVLNAALGFNVATTGTTAGEFNMLTFGWNFIFTSIPRLIMWDFSFLKYGEMVYLRYLFLTISIGFVVSMVITVASAMGGVLQRIFVR